jgi:hypothetical protein
MNRARLLVYPLVSILALAAAVSAHAESPTPDFSATEFIGPAKTRDQVKAELFQARADGSVRVWSISYNPLAVAKSLRSRDEVRAEAVAANMGGSDRAWLGEDSGSFALARQLPARADVRLLAQR